MCVTQIIESVCGLEYYPGAQTEARDLLKRSVIKNRLIRYLFPLEFMFTIGLESGFYNSPRWIPRTHQHSLSAGYSLSVLSIS